MRHTSTRISLIERLRDPRDSEAWKEFDERYRDLIRRYCARTGLQTADTEDVGQIVLMSLMRVFQAGGYDPAKGRFRHYLARIVTNAIYQQRARPGGTPLSLEDCVQEVLADLDDGPVDRAFEEEWSQHHLRRAMRSVRATCKPESLAVFERLLQGESVAQVARALQMTEQAVHKTKQRVGEMLRLGVERQLLDEESQLP